MSAAAALSIVASAVFLIRLLPQPVRLWRTGVTAGVSPVAAANAVIAESAWTYYGAVHGLFAVWLVSVFALVPGIWTVVLLRRRFGRIDVLVAVVMASAYVMSGLLGVLAVAIALSVLTTSGPQVWRAVVESDLRGIAPATWYVAIADATLWGAYGIVIGDAALTGYAAVLLSSAAIVLGRIAWTSRRGDAVATVPMAVSVIGG